MDLCKSGINGAGLKYLKDSTKLEKLVLEFCPITDDKEIHIKLFTQVTWLHLRETKVTEKGFMELTHLNQLFFFTFPENIPEPVLIQFYLKAVQYRALARRNGEKVPSLEMTPFYKLANGLD